MNISINLSVLHLVLHTVQSNCHTLTCSVTCSVTLRLRLDVIFHFVALWISINDLLVVAPSRNWIPEHFPPVLAAGTDIASPSQPEEKERVMLEFLFWCAGNKCFLFLFTVVNCQKYLVKAEFRVLKYSIVLPADPFTSHWVVCYRISADKWYLSHLKFAAHYSSAVSIISKGTI